MTRGLRNFRPVVSVILLWVVISSLLIAPSVQLSRGSPGIIRVPMDYSTIQAAVNAANPGDIILVSNGIYKESIVINKSLNLTGVSNVGVTINATRTGQAGVAVVNATNVSIQGFTILDNNLFNDTLWVTGSTHVIVSGNIMEASADSNATYIFNSSDSTVSGNTFTGNLYGVAIQGGFDNIVESNNSTGNIAGVAIFNSQGNRVTDNVLRRESFGVRLAGSTGNIIARNTVANDSFGGIYLENSAANRILENNIDFNRNPSSTAYGLYFSNSVNNRIYYNNIRNNSIQVYAVLTPADILQNYWNDSAIVSPKGNFWGNYNGTDADGDGVGDTFLPAPCPGGGRPCSYQGGPGVDYRPLMAPYSFPGLKVTASASPDYGLPPLQVGFTGSASGGAFPYSYNWTLGDGTTASTQNVTKTYSRLGSYTAVLTVNDSLGRVQSDLVTISIVEGILSVRVHSGGSQQLGTVNVTSLVQPAGQQPLSQTTNNGVANFTLLHPGTYTIQISSPGFVSATTTVNVVLNRTTLAAITLSPVGSSSSPTFWYLAGGAVAAVLVIGFLLFYRRRAMKNRSVGKSPSQSLG